MNKHCHDLNYINYDDAHHLITFDEIKIDRGYYILPPESEREKFVGGYSGLFNGKVVSSNYDHQLSVTQQQKLV